MSTFTELRFNSIDLYAKGITNSGEIVGTYVPVAGGFEQGFRFSNSSLSTFSQPDTQYVWSLDVSNSGNITGVGSTNSGLFAYSYVNGDFKVIGFPGAADTFPVGVNDRGQIVGTFVTPGDLEHRTTHGFLYSNGKFALMDAPGGGAASPSDINNQGQVVGTYVVGGQDHAFLYEKGKYVTIDDPDGISTFPTSINSQGDVVGYYQDSNFNYHGFIYSNGSFTTIDDPNANYATWPEDINDRGEIVGVYVNTSSGPHGFLLA
jgi:probable HAF family extracellular repeat protein